MPRFDPADDEVISYRKSSGGGLSVAYFSTYPPRECELAAYCEDILRREYRIDHKKIVLIHHGAPPPSRENRDSAGECFGLGGRRMRWPTVGARYVSILRDLLREQRALAPELAYLSVAAGSDFVHQRGIQ